MQRSEIAKLLIYINSIDARVVIEDSKVLAWERILNPHLPLEISRELVDLHYGNFKDSIMPADLNNLFGSKRRHPEAIAALVMPPIEIDAEWRAIVNADLKAKMKIDDGKPYKSGGIPWKFPMGSGQYAKEVGIDVFANPPQHSWNFSKKVEM